MNPILRNALVGSGLFGAGGLGGYILARRQGGEKLEAQENLFNQYNQEENQSLADEAFLEGVNYGLGKTSSLKESINTKEGNMENNEMFEKIASEAFEDELQKIAKSEAFTKILSRLGGAAKKVGSAVAGAGKKVGGAYKSSFQELKNIKSTYSKTPIKSILKGLREGGESRQLAKMYLKDAGKATAKAALIPATVTGLSIAGYKAAKK